MKLTEITIEKYKSITTPVNIKLNDKNRVYTFIGKNGSGKTNILEAIKALITKQNYYYNNDNKVYLQAKYILKLTNKEKKQFGFLDCGIDDKIYVYYDGKEINKKSINAPLINNKIQDLKKELKVTIEQFDSSSKLYLDKLQSIIGEYESSFNVIGIESENAWYLNQDALDRMRGWIIEQSQKINDYFNNNFNSEYLDIDANHELASIWVYNNLSAFQFVNIDKIGLSKVACRCLGFKDDEIDNVNNKLRDKLKEINNEIKKEYDDVFNSINHYNDLINKIQDAFSTARDRMYLSQEENDKKSELFLDILHSAIYGKSFIINNENLLFRTNDDGYYNYRQTFDDINPIMTAMDNFLKDNNYYKQYLIDDETGKMESESIVNFNKLSDNRKNYLIKILNNKFLKQLVPEFDKDEINGYVAKIDDNGNIALFVKEKNNYLVNFNDTSLGRRWYLTYVFIKSILKAGDYLFIDEPAAFLHPQAQIEFRKELDNLANKKGIYIFITTHSPYMITNDWSNVINVTMTNHKGTQIKVHKDKDEFCNVIKENLGICKANDLLFNMSKTVLLVEGPTDMVCVEKFAELLNYDISNYKITPCNGSPIFDVTYLCIEEGIKFVALMDADNKNKKPKFMSKKYGYIKYLDKFEHDNRCVFTPEDRKRKCLEDCFSEKDGEKYFSPMESYQYKENEITGEYIKELIVQDKIDKNKIKKVTSKEQFEQYTLDSFEQLFKEMKLPKKKNK